MLNQDRVSCLAFLVSLDPLPLFASKFQPWRWRTYKLFPRQGVAASSSYSQINVSEFAVLRLRPIVFEAAERAPHILRK